LISHLTHATQFRAFFSKYGEVADVAIGLNNGRLIDLFQARGVQELLIEEQIAKLKLYKLQALQKEVPYNDPRAHAHTHTLTHSLSLAHTHTHTHTHTRTRQH
jgi:hypothetical protein